MYLPIPAHPHLSHYVLAYTVHRGGWGRGRTKEGRPSTFSNLTAENLVHKDQFTCSTRQFSSVTQSCPTLCDPMDCSRPGLPVHHQLLEPTQTHVHLVGDAIQPPHPLLSPSPPALNLSQHQSLFQRISSSHQVAKYWSFSFNISHSNEYSALISFRIEWFYLLAVQRTLKSLLQYHSFQFLCMAVRVGL